MTALKNSVANADITAAVAAVPAAWLGSSDASALSSYLMARRTSLLAAGIAGAIP